MAQGLKSWSLTAADNGASDANINWSEGQLAPTVNNSARAMMAALAAFYDQLGGGGLTFGGSGNAYTATNPAQGTWSAYAAGDLIMLRPNATNTGAATINVDALGAKAIKTADGGDVASGDLVSGGYYLLAYDGTNFQVINTIGGGSYQPLDATLTALSLLSWSSGSQIPYFTAADTLSLATATAAGLALIDDADASAQRTTLGLGTAATQNTGTSGANVPLLNGNNTFSGQTIFSTLVACGSTLQQDYANPLFLWRNTAGATNEKYWTIQVASNYWVLQTRDDSYSSVTAQLTFVRSAAAAVSATFGGVVLVPAGSTSAPSVAGSGDTNTGIKFPGSDVLDIVAGGSIVGQATTSGLKDSAGNILASSGKQCIPIPAASFTPRTTSGAGISTTESTTNKIMLSALDFDASTAEYAQFIFPSMPKSWNESTITARFIWTAANTGNVVWAIRAVAISDDDALDAAFGTAMSVTDGVTAANDVMRSAETSAVTIAGTPAEGDMVVIEVYRDAANGSDTCAVDARLIGVELYVTTNAANDA